jgi:hypothetical protein
MTGNEKYIITKKKEFKGCVYMNLRAVQYNTGVGIATGWTPGIQSPVRADFSLLHNVKTGSGAHPAFYPRG